MIHYEKCPSDGTDCRGRCLGRCRECGEHLLNTGRYTVYCPSCDGCPECGCPAADGFSHYAGCIAVDDTLEESLAMLDLETA